MPNEEDILEWRKEFRRMFDCGWKEGEKNGGLYRFTFRVSAETYKKWKSIAYD